MTGQKTPDKRAVGMPVLGLARCRGGLLARADVSGLQPQGWLDLRHGAEEAAGRGL
jgi:hypothetical protein